MNAMNPIQLPGKSFDLNTFTYNGRSLRVVLIDGKPWFTLIDVAHAIELDRRVASNSRRFLDDAEARIVTRADFASGPQFEVMFPAGCKYPGLLMASESGFYKLIMRAQRSNPAARDFQDWVTKEVLPRIRRDGAYIMGEEKVKTGENCAGCPKEVHTAPHRATL